MRTRDSRTREQTCLQTCRLAQPQCIHDTRITLHLKLKSYRNSKNANPTLSSLNHWPLLRLFRRGTSTFPPPARLHSPERLRSARRHRPRRADVAHVMPVLRQEGCCAQSHSRWRADGERRRGGDERLDDGSCEENRVEHITGPVTKFWIPTVQIDVRACLHPGKVYQKGPLDLL